MKTLYLHVGTHKTGSSSIQKFLYNNKSEMQKRGFYYPSEGSYFYQNEFSQSLLAHSLLDKRPSYIGRGIVFNKESCISDIQKDLAQSRSPKVIISSEHFSLGFSQEKMSELKDILSPHFTDIKVIIYIRRQDLHLESGYNQCIKAAQTIETFEEFARRDRGRIHFEYLEMLSMVFGKDNLIVRPYEKKQLYNADVVKDFANILGLQLINENPVSQNESIPVEMSEIMRMVNRSLKVYKKQIMFNRFLRSAPIKFDDTKYTLCTPELRKEILGWHSKGNELVAKQYLGRDDGVLFYETEISNLPLYPGLKMERLTEVYAEIWGLQTQAYINAKNMALSKKTN